MGGVVDSVGDVLGGAADFVGDVVGGVGDFVGDVASNIDIEDAVKAYVMSEEILMLQHLQQLI
jgi:hypothetical protein